MKLSGFFRNVGKLVGAAVVDEAAKAIAKKAIARSKPRVQADGFDVARPTPVNLGKVPSASAASDGDFVKGLYRELLGREPDIDGFHAHMNGLENGMSREEIRNNFLASPEYRSKQAGPDAPAPAPDAPDAPATPASRRVQVGPVPLEGYNSEKLHNLDHQTVKYQFGRVASNHSLAGVKNHEQAEALLKSMVPALEAAGLKVHEVKRDKIRVETELGQEWVDVVRGAGSGSPGWWWGSEGKAIPGTTPAKPINPTNPGTPGGEAGAPLSTVKMLPEYSTAPIDKSSDKAAAKSAAQWVKDTYPQLFGIPDRQVAFQVMTHVIGAMRAAGYDAHRVVNHPSRPVGDGWRYGSDAMVVNGRIFDVYGSFGDPGRSDVQAHDAGEYAAGRLRE